MFQRHAIFEPLNPGTMLNSFQLFLCWRIHMILEGKSNTVARMAYGYHGKTMSRVREITDANSF